MTMLKTTQTDAVMQAILKEYSAHLTHDTFANSVAKMQALREHVECVCDGVYPMRRQHLLMSAALIVAELERMERAEAKADD